jgi:hypothetical protein
MTSNQHLRNTVCLAAYNQEEEAVLRDTLPIDKFYEHSHPLLDQPEFRKTRQIVRLRGVIHDAHGAPTQEFEVRFDASGNPIGEAMAPASAWAGTSHSDSRPSAAPS